VRTIGQVEIALPTAIPHTGAERPDDMLRNVRVKAQIEKPPRKEIVE